MQLQRIHASQFNIPVPQRINMELIIGALKRCSVTLLPLLVAIAALVCLSPHKAGMLKYIAFNFSTVLVFGAAASLIPSRYELQGSKLNAMMLSHFVFDALSYTTIDLSQDAITEIEMTTWLSYPAVRIWLATRRGRPSTNPYLVIYDPKYDAAVREQLLPALKQWKIG